MKILSSASKIVLLMVTITACVAFLLGKLEAQYFMTALGAVYGFYFAAKGDPAQPFGDK